MEAKLLLFNILKIFTFEPCDKTPKMFKLKPSFANFDLKEPIVVKLKLRK